MKFAVVGTFISLTMVLAGCQTLPHKHVRKTDTKIIIAEYESQKGDAKSCYNDYLKNNPGLEAKIVLRWTVDSGGRALNSQVKEDTLYQPSIGKCLLSHLNSLKFTPTPIFHRANIEYTFNLKSQPIVIE